MTDAPSATAPVRTPRRERPAFFWLASLALIVAMLARAQAILVPLALAIVVSFALSPAVQGGEGTGLAALSRSVDRVVHDLDEHVVADDGARPVRLVPPDATVTERIERTLTPVVAPLAQAGIVLVLVVCLLIKREDLRDRFIRLVGRGQVTLTTRTLDEVGRRISRFLAHQLAINAGFGAVVALGLYGIGIPYAPLWGFIATVLRFVPVAGTPLAMVVPAALAFAQFAGWWQLVATLGLFLGLELLTAYVIEPVVISAKTGLSSIAMLVSAVFWSWLWGPVGLVLSTPLAVCLAVLGKHVPRLSYLGVILGDEPALEDSLIVYQRLLSGDEAEAEEVLEKGFRATSRGRVFDDVVIPALLLAGRDRARNEISEADHQFVLRSIGALVDSVSEITGDPERSKPSGETPRSTPRRILGVSARTVTDEALWLPGTPILVIRPGVQANGTQSAAKLIAEGATRVCVTLEEAHRAAEQQLVMSGGHPLHAVPSVNQSEARVVSI